MKATPDQVEEFLKTLTYATRYEFLEVGKHDEELSTIAKDRGLVLPSPDLAIFKARYALLDTKNKNNCILERDEVEASLETLVGKRVDIDHLTRKVVGYWLGAKIVKDEIVSYGAIFKSSFGDEFEEIKRLMESGNAGVSFEAWGEREFHKDQSYSLRKIHFAGGGLLLTTEPAEPTARILELAKVLTPPAKFFSIGSDSSTKADKTLERARWYLWDIETIARLISEVKFAGADEKTHYMVTDILLIDFQNGKAVCKAEVMKEGKDPYEVIYEIEFSPKAQNVETSNTGRTVISVKELTNKTVGAEQRQGKGEVLGMDELETLKKQIETKDAEIAELKKGLETKTSEAAQSKDEATKLKAQVDQFEQADKDKRLAERKEALGEFAKDLTDEQLLSESEFEKAKLRKENAELKKQIEAAGQVVAVPKTLDTGSKSKSTDSTTFATQKRVQEHAFKPEGEK